MGLFDRISRVVRANMNDLVSTAEEPEKILEQVLMDMQEELIQLRQAVATAIASQKRLEQQMNQAQTQATSWQQRAVIALQKGQEDLARQALSRKKAFSETVLTHKTQLDQQVGQVDTLKRNLVALEGKIAEAKTKKDMLKARAQAAKAQEQLQSTIGILNTNSSMAAFERMEEKVLQMEARAQATAELAGNSLTSQVEALIATNSIDSNTASNSLIEQVEVTVIEEKEQVNTQLISSEIERQFAALEAEEDELAALKAELLGSPVRTRPTDTNQSQARTVDEELEALKRELDAL